ncbi:gamma-glutamyl-gamma-aminobutyrate hydrolase family protein [Sphingomonas quercus]|uniref:Gamma-glutamyl-gamma-aminobutyrate hydrolase family protein n=1 Tax=Sphingomonas quercus TaxID=2842451 RepID=A0ABS6BJC7_9SPHN|nr:gamma-glutamyl-gamma-aminobutyrate hydrolase family protein [Sphingomonas quercus]MBU3077921.1 gamma-glutamyl-gamma-aminobutyrate hydrolase family protein [Sphingomonas quercus]
MSARPILGIIACSRPSGEEITQAVVNRYVEAAARYGDAAPLIIPARPDLLTPTEAAARIDGLLLTGSPSNVQPSRYGEPDAEGSGPFDPGRDMMSLGLIEAMIARGRPVFGICRGFQEMNVAFGGTLARDLGEEARALSHHAPADVDFASMFGHLHDVALTRGGLLAAGLGRDRLRVSSVHFQGIGRLGDGLAVEARAPDGVVEAVSATVNGAQLLGVQWHPEWQVDADAASQGFFGLLGKALRGLALAPAEKMEKQA